MSQLAGWQAEQQVRQLAGRPAEPLSGRPEGCLVIMPAGRNLPWAMGREKAEVLAARFKDINPDIQLTVLPVFLKDDNIPELLDAAQYDFIVDAIDTLAPKCYLIAEALKRHIKIVSSMGAGAKSDITQIRFADIWDTYHCGLSKAVRKRLQKLGVKRKLPVVFSTEQADPKAVLLTEDEQNKKSTCGTVSYMPAVFGCYLAEYVIKRL